MNTASKSIFTFLALASTIIVDVHGKPLDVSSSSRFYNRATKDNTSTSTPASPASPSIDPGVQVAGSQGPLYVVYQDLEGPRSGPPPATALQGFNVYALGFISSKGPVDKAKEWIDMSRDDRQARKGEFNDAGIRIIASLFGQTEQPTTAGLDPKTVANTAAKFVLDNDLDGIDVDYEDLDAMNKKDGAAEQWVIDLTTALRQQLPIGRYLLTHAPIAPWFDNRTFTGGGYMKIHQKVGNLIDSYNIQYYNQGNDYTTCDTLITKSATFPGTAVMELMGRGIPSNKITIGKPATSADATTGFMTPVALAQCGFKAQAAGWSGGWMTWEYPNGDTNWINTVKTGVVFNAATNPNVTTMPTSPFTVKLAVPMSVQILVGLELFLPILVVVMMAQMFLQQHEHLRLLKQEFLSRLPVGGQGAAGQSHYQEKEELNSTVGASSKEDGYGSETVTASSRSSMTDVSSDTKGSVANGLDVPAPQVKISRHD